MEGDTTAVPLDVWPQCDCGYRCQGHTLDERVRDGQHHARAVHGIDVTDEQILKEGRST
jgi:predicted small metal-binding protein